MKKHLFLSVIVASATALFSSSAMADAAAGQKLFKKKCAMCHKLDKNAIGPKLKGILGRKAGSTDYKKYKALKGADFVWDEDNLSDWIKDPKKFIGKKTSMAGKIKKEKDRDAIIAYLKTQ